ncbi:hypothetical protein [Paenibacillus illinoisensis]
MNSGTGEEEANTQAEAGRWGKRGRGGMDGTGNGVSLVYTDDESSN